MSRTYTALVLAGSRGGSDPVAAAAGMPWKFAVPAAGMPMLTRVIEALRASRSVGAIAVCGPAAPLEELLRSACHSGVRAIEGEATPSRSVLAAAEAIGAWPLLVTTADHPLLTPEIVDWFCRRADERGAAVVAGLATAAVIGARFPKTKRTYLRFADAPRSGCNLFALRGPAALEAVRFWTRVERERKRPWRIVRAFGPVPLALFLLGRLSLAGAMARASRVVGVGIDAVDLPFAEAAVDVDNPDDLALVEMLLRAKHGMSGSCPDGASSPCRFE